MAEVDVAIKVEIPLHLGSGQADINLDSEIVYDSLGLPYFPAKRFKGLLYENAVEVFKIFDLAGISTKNILPPEKFFHRFSDDAGKVSEFQITLPNFYLKDHLKLRADWKYLQKKYPEIFRPAEVLKSFSSVRYQTKLENVIIVDGSLRNLNVLKSGEIFYGKCAILNSSRCVINLIALALKNLTAAGTKRNSDFGRITCTAKFENDSVDGIIKKIFAKGYENVRNKIFKNYFTAA